MRSWRGINRRLGDYPSPHTHLLSRTCVQLRSERLCVSPLYLYIRAPGVYHLFRFTLLRCYVKTMNLTNMTAVARLFVPEKPRENQRKRRRTTDYCCTRSHSMDMCDQHHHKRSLTAIAACRPSLPLIEHPPFDRAPSSRYKK